MDRQFTAYRRITTNQPPDRVFAAVEQSLRSTVGGFIQRIDNSFHIQNGTNNLTFAFVGDLTAIVTLTQPSQGVVDINAVITLKPNALFWFCAIVGFFCLWFMWSVNLMYFLLDPRSNYQLALDRIQLLPVSGEPVPPPKQYG